MAAATRERALQAAVELLGTQGVRALTHARVDASAGLPPGSTSNWFRTRRALLSGVVDWISERETADFDPTELLAVTGVEGLVEGLCAMAEHRVVGELAVQARARYALFLEVSDDPEIGPRLRETHQRFQRWTEEVVAAAGIADPVPASRALMALVDGLVMHRLTLDPALDVRVAIRTAIRALEAD